MRFSRRKSQYQKIEEGEKGWGEIGRELGISGERARQLAFKAMEKVRRRAPWLAEIFAASERARDLRSPAQMVVDENISER